MNSLRTSVSRRTLLLGAALAYGCAVVPAPKPAANVVRWRGYAPSTFGQMHCYFAAPSVPVRRRPLVCLHQSPTTGISYAEFQDEMAQDRLVICPDTAGYGDSDGPSAIPDMAAYANALAAALEGLGFGPDGLGAVDLLGFHTGNFVALELAATRPDLVSRLVMPGIPYYSPQERQSRLGQYAKPRPYFTDPDYLGSTYRRMIFDASYAGSRERRHELFVSRLLSGTRSHYGFAAVSQYDPDPRLGQIRQPVLLPILNETLAEPTRRAGALIKDVRKRELPDLTGFAWYEHPGRLAAEVRPFLADELAEHGVEVTAGASGQAGGPRDGPDRAMQEAGAAGGLRRWRFYLPCRYGQIHCHAAAPAQQKPTQPPLVLLHQSPLSGAVYSRLQGKLAQDRVVICPDTSGFGNSTGPESQPTMADYGGALADALLALGHSRGNQVDVFGFHTGTFVATEAAVQQPQLFRKVVLCGVPYYPAAERSAMQAKFLKPYAFLTDPAYVDEMWKRMMFGGESDMPRDVQFGRFVDRMRAGPNGEWGPRAVFAYDADRGLRAISQPLLLLAFNEVMKEPTRAVSRFLPQARYEVLGELNMMGFVTRPETVAAALRRFLG